MKKLNLDHLKDIPIGNKHLLGDFHPLSNKFINEWVRYIKYSLSKKLIDSEFNLYMTYKDLKKVSIVYSSDKLNDFNSILDYLITREYLYVDSDIFYFNSTYFISEMLIRTHVKMEKKDYYTFYSPWHMVRDRDTFIILGYSDIMNSLTPLCIRPTLNIYDNNDIDLLSDKLFCPAYLDVLNKCFNYFKKHNDFIHSKVIKEFFSSLNSINPSSIMFNSLEELSSYLNTLESNDPILITCNNLFSHEETLILVENKDICAIFPIIPYLKYEMYSTALAMQNLNTIKLLLKELRPLITLDEDLMISIDELF